MDQKELISGCERLTRERVIDALRRAFPGAWSYDRERAPYPWVRLDDGLAVGVFAKMTPRFDGDDETYESTFYTSSGENIGRRMGRHIVLYRRPPQPAKEERLDWWNPNADGEATVIRNKWRAAGLGQW